MKGKEGFFLGGFSLIYFCPSSVLELHVHAMVACLTRM